MYKVYKYKISPHNPKIKMPKGAEILTGAFQSGDFCVWAEIDTENELEDRYIHVFATGEEIPYDMGVDFKYIATGFMGVDIGFMGGNGLVFHAYERLGL